MSKIYLSADIINGVCVFDLDLLKYENENNILHEIEFYNCLPHLKDNDFIVGLVSKGLYDKIKKEYGICQW